MTVKKYILTADDVIDNLTSDLEDVPLSANQGRVLDTSKVAKYQGTQYAGKVLGIGDDGNVTPVEGGGGTTSSITASAGSNGTISPSGVTVVEKGGSLSVQFSANSGYEVDTVLVDGVSVSKVSPYVFSNIQTNHTISVTFKLITKYTMTWGTGSSATITNNITYSDDAAGMTESQRDTLIKSHTKFAVVDYDATAGKPVVKYWLYRNDLTQKATDETCDVSAGTASVLTGADGDVMVLYDPVWWTVSRSGNNVSVSFSFAEQSGWTTPHMYGTTQVKYAGMGVFEGILDSGKLRSVNLAYQPTVSTTQNNFYSAAISGRNAQYNQMLPMTWAWYIISLYFVKGNRNTQAAYGNGYVASSHSSAAAINKDWSATNAWINGDTSGQDKCVTALGVHNGWGNIYKFFGECQNMGATIRFTKQGGYDHGNIESTTVPSSWASSTGAATSSQCMTDIRDSCKEFPFFASECAASDYSTCYADYQYIPNSSSPSCVYAGGAWNDGLVAGALSVRASYGAASSGSHIGARLHVMIV